MKPKSPVTSSDNQDSAVKRVISPEEEQHRMRRDGELIIIMDEAEKSGMTFDRFIAAFCELYQNKREKALQELTAISQEYGLYETRLSAESNASPNENGDTSLQAKDTPKV